MTADIIQFKRKGAVETEDKPKRTKGQANQAHVSRMLTTHDIFMDVTDEVVSEWQKAAVNNRLSEYIAKKIPAFARGPKSSDYVNDLNVIASVEQKLNMKLAVFFPGCTPNNKIGWLVAFHREKEIFSTPPDMASESMARALNVVLYVSFENVMKTLGRS